MRERIRQNAVALGFSVMAWCRVATTDSGRTAGFQKQEKSEMTKQLREWTAPDGRVWVWNPDFMIAEVRDKHGLWTLGNNSELLDHADALNALRADPYVAPKGLREQIADALSNAYEAGRYGLGAPGWSGVSTIADAVVEMIDRERPALGDVDGEVLVGELVRRGWNFHPAPTRKAVDMLTAPERAG